MKFVFALLLVPFYSFALVDVAFLEVRRYDGSIVRFEPNDRFAHIAISYRGNWLHAHPLRGVEIVSRRMLEKVGTVKEVVTIPEASLNDNLVKSFLNRSYDPLFSWDDDKLYCSELVAKLLNIEPLPMTIDPTRLGISPDEIFSFLR